MSEKTQHTLLAPLLERLLSDGGRYLLSVALTSEERRAQPEPTYGGKGHSRWLTQDEHAALCAALNSHAALLAALERTRVLLRAACVNYNAKTGKSIVEAIKVIDAALATARGEL